MKPIFFLLLLVSACGKSDGNLLLRDGNVTHRLPVTEEVFSQTTEDAVEKSFQELQSDELDLKTVTIGLSLDVRAGEGVTVQAGKTVDLHFEAAVE